MPKLKTNKGAKKRFRFTAKGKVKFKKAYLRHILTNKGNNQKRGLRHSGILAESDVKAIKQMLPYG